MIQVDWDSPTQRFIHFTFAGRWTWPELEAGLTQARHLIEATNRPIYYVIHLTDSEARMHVPASVFWYATASRSHLPSNVAKTIVVNANSIAFGIMSIVFRLHPELQRYYVFTATLEEAERLIALETQT
jgi:hypothetical protein